MSRRSALVGLWGVLALVFVAGVVQEEGDPLAVAALSGGAFLLTFVAAWALARLAPRGLSRPAPVLLVVASGALSVLVAQSVPSGRAGFVALWCLLGAGSGLMLGFGGPDRGDLA